jgi:hypothetical protein
MDWNPSGSLTTLQLTRPVAMKPGALVTQPAATASDQFVRVADPMPVQFGQQAEEPGRIIPVALRQNARASFEFSLGGKPVDADEWIRTLDYPEKQYVSQIHYAISVFMAESDRIEQRKTALGHAITLILQDKGEKYTRPEALRAFGEAALLYLMADPTQEIQGALREGLQDKRKSQLYQPGKGNTAWLVTLPKVTPAPEVEASAPTAQNHEPALPTRPAQPRRTARDPLAPRTAAEPKPAPKPAAWPAFRYQGETVDMQATLARLTNNIPDKRMASVLGTISALWGQRASEPVKVVESIMAFFDEFASVYPRAMFRESSDIQELLREYAALEGKHKPLYTWYANQGVEAFGLMVAATRHLLEHGNADVRLALMKYEEQGNMLTNALARSIVQTCLRDKNEEVRIAAWPRRNAHTES